MTITAERAGISDVAIASVLEWVAHLLLAPPSEVEVAQLRASEGRAVLDAIAAEWTCHAATCQMLAALGAAAPVHSVASDLSVAYTRLFEGVSGIPAVPLYESTYVTADCQVSAPPRLYGHAAGEMDELLRRFGLRIGAAREAPDHISIELALYAALLRKGDAGEAASMRERLTRWVPTLIDRCLALDPDGFYGGVAQLLKNLLEAQGVDAWFQPVSMTYAQDGSHYVE